MGDQVMPERVLHLKSDSGRIARFSMIGVIVRRKRDKQMICRSHAAVLIGETEVLHLYFLRIKP